MKGPTRLWLPAALALLAFCAGGCGEESEPPHTAGTAPEGAERALGGEPPARRGPPGARWEMVEMLRESRDLEYDPSDGGGRAWLEEGEDGLPVATAGMPGRFPVVFEVGPMGIATGGAIHFQVSPFWEWNTPQTRIPEAPGYTVVEGPEDADLEAGTLDDQLLGIRVAGRPLRAGERVRIAYGAGPAGARADRYAEKGSRFWIAVDGDGDGSRRFLVDSPGVDVLPGPPAGLVVTGPTIARPGERFRVTVAVLDAAANAGNPVVGEIVFSDVPAGVELPPSIRLAPEDLGRKTVEAVAREAGVLRLRAEGPLPGMSAETNPIVVSEGGPLVLWADLHGHSAWSDGTGTPEDYFLYARDVAALDIAALTDHDHWGILKLDAQPEIWDEIQTVTKRFDEPGRFTTLLGFEWTSWIHGHRHVLYFDDEGPVISSIDPAFESPTQLWKALEGRSALTFAHHSAGGPIQTNWDIPPDPRFEPVTEIVSVHGSSEALDSPAVIYSPVPGNFVRDVLDRGYRFGFVGSGDSHDGHPGLAHLIAPSGGLAAVLAESNTREAILAALRARRVYASNGPRMLLRVAFGAHPMGATVPVAAGETASDELFVHVVGATPLARIDLVRSGEVVDSIDVAGRLDVALQMRVENVAPGEYLYLRAVQEDGGAVWSSPIYFGND